MRFFIICLSACLVLPTPLAAQDASSPLADLYACRAVADDMARLACLDAQVDLLASKEQKKEIVAIDAEEVAEARSRSFGLPSISFPELRFGGDDDAGDTPPSERVFKVKSIERSSRDRSDITFTFENGMVWEIVTGDPGYIPRGDLTATVKKRALGSFLMTVSNGQRKSRSMRVRRVE